MCIVFIRGWVFGQARAWLDVRSGSGLVVNFGAEGVGLVPGNTDGVRADGGDVAVAADGEVVPIGSCLQHMVDGVHEVIAMRLNVESYDVGAEESVD